MRSKKGFTLVELLAVIAIFAILMLLIMPNVLKMFNSGKKNAFKTQVGSIMKSAIMQSQADVIAGNSDHVVCVNVDGCNKQIYCGGIDECPDRIKLNITETDIKYVVLLEDNKVTTVALSDNNYCYVNNGDVDNIDSKDFVEGGVLSCNGVDCVCTSNGSTIAPVGDRNVYWTIREANTGVNYASNAMPSTTYNSIADMNITGTEKLIKTRVDKDGNATKHSVCLYYNNKLLCLDSGYWVEGDNDGTLTKAKLEADMTSTLGVKPSCSNIDTSRTDCYYQNGVRCKASKNGDVLCANSSSETCNVYSNGKARCF